jgi:hypothetical protein
LQDGDRFPGVATREEYEDGNAEHQCPEHNPSTDGQGFHRFILPASRP